MPSSSVTVSVYNYNSSVVMVVVVCVSFHQSYVSGDHSSHKSAFHHSTTAASHAATHNHRSWFNDDCSVSNATTNDNFREILRSELDSACRHAHKEEFNPFSQAKWYAEESQRHPSRADHFSNHRISIANFDVDLVIQVDDLVLHKLELPARVLSSAHTHG